MYFGSSSVREYVLFAEKKKKRKKKRNLQLVGAVSGLVHAMALFKQLEELLNGDARVG